MKFFHTIQKCFYDPAFYATIPAHSFKTVFKYFFSLVAVVALVCAFGLGIRFSSFFTAENLQGFVKEFPAELTVFAKDGKISTNVTEPYTIVGPTDLSQNAGYAHLVVIDTSAPFSVAAFEKHDTRVLVGKDFIATSKKPGQFEINSLSNMPDLTLNQATLSLWAEKVDSHHLLMSLFLFFFFLFATFGFFTVKLIWLIACALAIFFFARLFQMTLSYGSSYKISVYAATAPIILQALLLIAGVSVPFAFFYSLIFFLVVTINLSRSPSVQSV